MKLGKTLWALIIIKLFVMFFVLKALFFDETINTKFTNEADKIDFVYKNLTKDR